MKTHLLIAFAILLPSASFAADMPVKAAPRSFIGAYPYERGGFYFGVGTLGETEKVDLNSPIANTSTFAAGGALTASIGYTRPMSAGSWAAIEGTFAYANTGANANGVSIGSKMSGELLVKYGGNLDSLSALIPNLGTAFPTMPTIGTENPLVHPYVGAGVLIAQDEANMLGINSQKTKTRTVGRVGFLTQKNNGTVIDTWAEWSPKTGSGFALPNFQADVGERYRVGLSVFWGLSK